MYLNKILLTTDFSDYAASAYKIALHEARQSNSEITLLHILQPNFTPVVLEGYVPPADYFEALEAEQLLETQQKLQKEIETHFSSVKVNCLVLRVADSPASAICQYAKENNFGLIITASHGKSVTKRFIFGSVTERIARLSSRPVLVTRSSTNPNCLAEEKYKNILVTTDFSENSEQAFKYAAYEAKLNNAKVTLVHVAQSLIAPELLTKRDLREKYDPEKIQAEYINHLEIRLKQYAKEHFPLSSIETKLIEKSFSVSDTIIEFSKSMAPDLIVISTHGQGKTFQLIGGIAERVLRYTSCPVLLIPNSKK